MRIEQRLKKLTERKGCALSPDKRFKASLEVFRLVHEREPTAKEADELRADAWLQEPASLPQRIAEIEKMVYESVTE